MNSKDRFSADATRQKSALDDSFDDPRIAQAVQEYLQQMEAGQAPQRQEFLKRYPDLAVPLAKCLDGLELVHKAAARSKSGTAAAFPGVGDNLPANPLGDFQILREIGRGGMGVVYEAMQLSLGRRVALKVLPFAATFDAKHLQRFQNEAHAAAQLHHTNIVPVYFVGCERGVHFYAMQLIDGKTLAEVLQHLRKQESGDRSQGSGVRSQGATGGGQDLAGIVDDVTAVETVSPLSMAISTQRTSNQREFYRTAARFMVQAAEALEHAHQYGIVHRDIKPANLLVDDHGRLWVTDFGLAITAEAGLTKTGDVLGTLRYMSPEQAGGLRLLLDHRTDIYSLGATLYELATLKPIFPGQNQQELLRQILHDEPKSPRSLDPNLPIELETIILKAISKNPADRYDSAKELAADLQRFLQDEPIQAQRPTLVDRVRKWTRRHPAFMRAAVVLLFFGVIGFAISTALIAREQGRTKAAYDQELKRAKEADERFQLARRSVDEMIQIAQDESFDNPAVQNVRRRLLESALIYYQEFIELRGKDPDGQAELAATRNRVQKILDDLSVLQGAWQHGLVRHKSVHDDLELSPEQRDRLKEWDKQQQETFKDFFKLTQDERQKRFLELARANESLIADILEPSQQTRLRQIGLQARGPMAFLESDVAAQLKLTAEQKRQIRGFDSAMMRFDKPPFEPKGGPPGVPFGKGFEHRRKETMEKIEALLTDDQKKQWKEMIGVPFTTPIFLPPGAPGMFNPPPPPKDGKGPPKKKDRDGPKKF